MKRGSQLKKERIREYILDHVEDHPRDITLLVSRKFKISRQAAHKHVKELKDSNLLESEGFRWNTTYRLKSIVSFSKRYEITDQLEEHVIWNHDIAPYFLGLRKNVYGICNYGLCEMLNNAIEHSQGSSIEVQLFINARKIEFYIHDNGIGIFQKIQQAFDLEEPYLAILELVKGKLTTDPKNHSGEGIFFTSRMVDDFGILSSQLFYGHKADQDNWLIEARESELDGTTIAIKISLKTSRTPKKVFDSYTSGDTQAFTKTHIPVELYKYGDENLISRSQAKRLLSRFENFDEVFLNFHGVSTVGRAFIDEIFRVFRQQHPEVAVAYFNANQTIDNLIKLSMAQEVPVAQEQLKLDL